MKLIALLFLMVACWGTAAASALPSPHHCCQDAHCAMPECINMACLAAPVAFAPTAAAVTSVQRQPMARPQAQQLALPLTVREVWTPPD